MIFWDVALGLLVPFFVPTTHIFILQYWSVYAYEVRPDRCTCTCWDTIFKANFESGLSTGYKHMYFNATRNTMFMWLLVVTGAIASYEGYKKTIRLLFRQSARFPMVLMFCTSIVSQYIGWWDLINFINDDHYTQLNYQLFMSVVELLSSIYVLHLTSVQVRLTNKKLSIISGLALVRMVHRFVNEFYGLWVFSDEEPGSQDQLRADLIKGVPDLVHFLFPIFIMQMKLRSARKYRRIIENNSYNLADVFFLFNVFLFFTVLTLLVIFRDFLYIF